MANSEDGYEGVFWGTTGVVPALPPTWMQGVLVLRVDDERVSYNFNQLRQLADVCGVVHSTLNRDNYEDKYNIRGTVYDGDLYGAFLDAFGTRNDLSGDSWVCKALELKYLNVFHNLPAMLRYPTPIGIVQLGEVKVFYNHTKEGFEQQQVLNLRGL